MAEVEAQEFSVFKAEFCKWQQRFGLTGVQVYFNYEPVDGCFAQITRPRDGHQVSTVRLNSCVPKRDRQHINPARTAKHEAIHLLLSRIYMLAIDRYASAASMEEAEEELCIKLEGLIADA